MTNSTERTALIIGATGLFGLHAAEALIKHGWRVRALARNPDAAAARLGPRTPIDWIKGDAMDAESVIIHVLTVHIVEETPVVGVVPGAAATEPEVIKKGKVEEGEEGAAAPAPGAKLAAAGDKKAAAAPAKAEAKKPEGK